MIEILKFSICFHLESDCWSLLQTEKYSKINWNILNIWLHTTV